MAVSGRRVIPTDEKLRIVKATIDEKLTLPVSAKRHQVSASAVARWVREYRATGTIAESKPRGRRTNGNGHDNGQALALRDRPTPMQELRLKNERLRKALAAMVINAVESGILKLGDDN
jgi:transposase-like protein